MKFSFHFDAKYLETKMTENKANKKPRSHVLQKMKCPTNNADSNESNIQNERQQCGSQFGFSGANSK